MKTKSFKQSKVVWINAIILVGALFYPKIKAALNIDLPSIEDNMLEVTAVANLFMRLFFTKTALTMDLKHD